VAPDPVLIALAAILLIVKITSTELATASGGDGRGKPGAVFPLPSQTCADQMRMNVLCKRNPHPHEGLISASTGKRPSRQFRPRRGASLRGLPGAPESIPGSNPESTFVGGKPASQSAI